MKPTFKKMSAVLVGAGLVLSGCSGGTDAPATKGAGDAKASSDPVKISLMFRGTDAVAKNVELFKQKVKEKLNVDLDIQLIDKNVYDEKLNVAFAAGNAADIIRVDDMKTRAEALKSNAVLPIDDAVKADPDFSKVDKKYFIDSTYKGKIYSLPRYKRMPESIYYRVDWANKLNLKTPTNADELYQMLYAFAKQDPDGNKKDDTFGFTMQSNLEGSTAFWDLFIPALPRSLALYLDKDDQIKSAWLLNDDMKKALTWFRKASADGVLDKEWVLEKSSTAEDKFTTGKTGAWTKGAQWIVPRSDKLKKAFPEAEINSLPLVKGAYGPNYKVTEQYSEYYMVNAKSKNPDIAKKVLLYMHGQEGLAIWNLGQEGVTYKVDNGKLNIMDKEMANLYNPGQLLTSVFDIKLPVAEPLLEKSIKSVDGFEITKPLDEYYQASSLAVSKSADIEKMMQEAVSKIILGEQPVDQYDNAVKKLKDMNIDKMLQEINDAYKKSK